MYVGSTCVNMAHVPQYINYSFTRGNAMITVHHSPVSFGNISSRCRYLSYVPNAIIGVQVSVILSMI